MFKQNIKLHKAFYIPPLGVVKYTFKRLLFSEFIERKIRKICVKGYGKQHLVMVYSTLIIIRYVFPVARVKIEYIVSSL